MALIKGILLLWRIVLLWRIHIAVMITTKNNTIMKVMVMSHMRMLDMNIVSRT
jgi:hypothetical protein